MPHPFSSTPLPVAAPSLRRVLAEATTPRDAARLLLRAPSLVAAPRADPTDRRLVIDIPGYMAPGASMAPLRAYLRWLGHDARGWGLGHNTSDVVGKVRRFVPLVRRLADEHGGPVTLVGWSLGGLVARETARDAPDAVDRVITYGTPVISGPLFTTARIGYSRAAIHAFAAAADARTRFPIQRPVTAMVSRRDGIVQWHAQVDHTSPDVEHVEVSSTHLGMGLDPDVWLTAARRLAVPTAAATAGAVRDRAA